MKPNGFLSFASADRDFAGVVKAKVGEMLSNEGRPDAVWDDASTLANGEDVRQAIKSAIDASNTVVVVMSAEGDASAWVNDEAAMADALDKDLILVGRKGGGKSALLESLRHRARIMEIDEAS